MSQLIVLKIEYWCVEILEEATRAGVTWRTVVKAAAALGDFCDILMEDQNFLDIRAPMWYRV